jgi:hypothetical protein
VLTATRQVVTYIRSRGDSNRYTSRGRNLIHTTRMLLTSVHVCHSYASYGQSTYVTTFHAGPRVLDGFTTSEKKCSWLHPHLGWVAHGTHPSFSPNNNHWSSALKPSIYWWTCYICLLGSYLQYVITTFNICSRGPIHRSLIDTSGGYNLGGAGFPQHTPHPSQPMILYFCQSGLWHFPWNYDKSSSWRFIIWRD